MKKLGFGFMRLPVHDEENRATVNMELTKNMVDLFMKSGLNYFDTAHRYNDEMSEVALKQTLTDRYDRNTYILANKITMNYIKSEQDQEPFFHNQLKTCGVSYFDNYLVHNMGEAFYPLACKYHTFEFIRKMKEQGYVRHVGFSFHGSPELLEEILQKYPQMEYVQLQINYLDWNDPAIRARECYEIAKKYQKKIIVMEPVKGGTLVNLPQKAKELLHKEDEDLSLASWAIRFAASLEGVEMVLSGMSTLDQVLDNTSFMNNFVPLNTYEIELLEKVADVIRENTEIGCTNCRYCTTECPKNIAIPDYFAIYNNMKRLENNSYLRNQMVYYNNLSMKHGKASECIKCGICEKNCPQKIEIREKLKLVADVFEKTII
ncbi:MAG: 4Fe-4S dicluster domain-containing protein [Clostridia bacterium]|nr:4Fe-4S dicluster domain-containing protein [Clostridia bacterium]